MSDFIRDPGQNLSSTAFSEPRPVISSDWNLISKAGDLAYLPHCSPVCVRLDVEDLPCFTVVNRQYEAWGVRFENAVAIHPSNPLYPPYSGEMVLLGAPRDGWLEARFLHPVRHVGSCVVSSRRTVIQAFNRQNQLVAEAAAEANLGQGNTSLRLSSAAQNIHRVTLECFDGQLTVDDFCFCS